MNTTLLQFTLDIHWSVFFYVQTQKVDKKHTDFLIINFKKQLKTIQKDYLGDKCKNV